MTTNKEVKQKTNYAYAYGRLDSALNMLPGNLEWECRKNNIEVEPAVIRLLELMSRDVREKAVIESYKYS